ncbi:MAG: PAS domain S-box protein [Myxococcales bacterium]|nr:PAS domain S-box protein [Myxococcales bacterium]
MRDAEVRWRHVGGTEWADPEPPWRTDQMWQGVAEGVIQGSSRYFQIVSARHPGGYAWQFVEESPFARHHRLIARAVDALPDAFSITTAELTRPGPQFVFANQAFTSLTGYSTTEILENTPRVLQGARTDRAELDRLATCLNAGQPFKGGAVNYRKTGEPFWNEWDITPIRDAQGHVKHYVSMMRDVTAYRVAHHRVQAAASEWASIIDALDANIVMTHEDGAIARCNRAFADLVGLPFTRLVGEPLAMILQGSTTSTLPAGMFQVRPTTIKLERYGGWFAVDGRPISKDGRIVGWVHTLNNVTPSEQNAEQLRRLAAASEHANDGIAVLDAAARIEYVNPELARMLGLERAELQHRDVATCGLLPEPGDALARARERGSDTVRHTLVAANGSRSVLEIAIGRVASGDELGGYVVIARDLTERERLWRIAEHASTLGNISHWLGGLRHELGNPVGSVKMALTVLQTHLPTLSAPAIATLVDRAASELGRVEFLLKTLKTFSLFDSLDCEAIEIAPFFERVAQLFEPDLTRAGIALTTAAGAALVVRGDRRALHQIFVNLLSNAMDATAGMGGAIGLEAQLVGEAVRLVVRDQGTGMGAAQLERLFRPFETTKPHGTGLGLILVRRLVSLMSGRMEIASVEGRGTTVTLSFNVEGACIPA